MATPVCIFKCSSSYLHDSWSGGEIGLLSLRLSISQGASLGYVLLVFACPMVHGEGNSMGGVPLYLMTESKTDKGVAKDGIVAPNGNRSWDFESKAQYTIHWAITLPPYPSELLY